MKMKLIFFCRVKLAHFYGWKNRQSKIRT